MSLGEEYQSDLEVEYAYQSHIAECLSETMECPKCKNKLREIEGKNGLFLGCTEFPKCKFSISLE